MVGSCSETYLGKPVPPTKGKEKRSSTFIGDYRIVSYCITGAHKCVSSSKRSNMNVKAEHTTGGKSIRKYLIVLNFSKERDDKDNFPKDHVKDFSV